MNVPISESTLVDGTRWVIKPYLDLTLDELYQALRLRSEVFVVEQSCVYNDLDGRDSKAWHLLGWRENELIAYVRIFPVGARFEEESSIGRVATSKTVRGQGQGRLAMVISMRWLQKISPNANLRIFAQSYLKSFYESLGFQVVSEEEREDGIPHYWMVCSRSQDSTPLMVK
jgi:ElaA protein